LLCPIIGILEIPASEKQGTEADLMQDLAPAIIESIKTAGLVLVTDVSDKGSREMSGGLGVARPIGNYVPNGVDGILKGSGVLRFNESIDV